MKRASKFGFICGISGLILLCACYVISAAYDVQRARKLLRSVNAMKLDIAGLPEARSLTRKYGGQETGVTWGNSACSEHGCVLIIKIENKLLRFLHRDRTVSLLVSLIIVDGRLVSKQVQYGMGTQSVPVFGYILFDNAKASEGYRDVRELRQDASGVSHLVGVELLPSTAPELRNRAYSLELSCLVKFYDCEKRSDFIPAGF